MEDLPVGRATSCAGRSDPASAGASFVAPGLGWWCLALARVRPWRGAAVLGAWNPPRAAAVSRTGCAAMAGRRAVCVARTPVVDGPAGDFTVMRGGRLIVITQYLELRFTFSAVTGAVAP